MADNQEYITNDPNTWNTGAKTSGSSTVPTAGQWMSTGDGASITGTQSTTPATSTTTPTPQTWQSLNDYLQQQYNTQHGYDPNAVVRQQDENGFSFDAPLQQTAWNAPNTDANGVSSGLVSGLTLPGQQGTWQWQPSANLPGGGQFMQEGTNLGNNQYNSISQGADGNVLSSTKTSPTNNGSFWSDVFGQSGLTGFVKDVLPIAAWVSTPFTLGAGVEGLAGAGAADAGAGAGWVSAEGGAGYSGGMAADAGALGGAGVATAPGVTSGSSGTTGTGASGGVEPTGWTSAENGAGYSNGSVIDNAAGSIGGAPVTSNPVPNTGNIYTGNAPLPAGYGTPSTLGNLYDKAVTGLGNMTLGDYLKAGAGIGSAVKGYTNSQNTVANNTAYQQQINNMYAPGSPEYLALQQQMERQDAANGRNSQYGTRLAEMGAKIAQLKMQALTSPAYANSVASTNQASSQDLNGLFALMSGAGTYIK